jgi:hypothetical protein
MATKPGQQLPSFWGAAKNKLTPTIRTEGGPRPTKATESTTAPKTNAPQVSPIAGTDAALSQLQNSLALANAQKKNNT